MDFYRIGVVPQFAGLALLLWLNSIISSASFRSALARGPS
jgi:hypothetical protein